MNIKPTQLTINCCDLIRALLPTDPAALLSLVLDISDRLHIQPDEALQFISRSEKPSATPVYDGKHDTMDWYNNNLQMPRLLLAICDHLGISENIPAHYRIADHHSNTLAQAQIALNTYVRQQQALSAKG